MVTGTVILIGTLIILIIAIGQIAYSNVFEHILKDWILTLRFFLGCVVGLLGTFYLMVVIATTYEVCSIAHDGLVISKRESIKNEANQGERVVALYFCKNGQLNSELIINDIEDEQ